MIAAMFFPTVDFVLPSEIWTNEANAEIETQTVTAEARISKCSTKFKYLPFLLYFSLIKSFLASSIFLNLKFRLTFST